MVISVVDIGGSHVSYALYDVERKDLIGQKSIPLASDVTKRSPLKVLEEIATLAVSRKGLAGMSLAVPGPFDHATGVSQMQHKLAELYGVDLKLMLSRLLNLPANAITFLNDADAFLLGALTESSLPDAHSIGITLGTGIGSAFSAAGKILLTGTHVPPNGEIWNLPFQGGIVEDVLSTKTLVESYAQQTGIRQNPSQIAESAKQGERAALNVFSVYGEHLGCILQELTEFFAAEQILLGGGICSAAELFLTALDGQMHQPKTVQVARNRSVAPLLGAGIAWHPTADDHSPR